MRVFVYFNLHKKRWSVRALEGDQKGLVIAHCDEVWLRNATTRVSEKGRQRVLRERRKNVHAGIVGEWCEAQEGFSGRQITYDPYRFASFVFRDDHSPCPGAEMIKMQQGRVWVAD